MITLFPDEKIITESDGKVITLTTHRVCLEEKSGGRLSYKHIMLEHVTSTEVDGVNYYFLLWIAALALLAGVYLQGKEEDSAMIFFGAGVFSVVAFFITRQYTIMIGSASTKMKVNATNMSKDTISAFLNKIEAAQNERAKYLAKIG